MSEIKQQQEEEREVLLSIYDGDPAFKHLSPTVFQYKYGEDESPKSFLLEISWGASYPAEKPSINMDTFYNKHSVPDVKDQVVSQVKEEAEQYLGTAMTYTLFEFVKEKLEELLAGQPDSFVNDVTDSIDRITISGTQALESASKKMVKKEQLSKAQKRKQWDRVDGKGDRPRGWNWIDVVKHLSQTGPKQSPDSELPTTPSPPLNF
ncbi:RWD domain-containing protein 4A [Zootermopsis nevadensis]|uniref:RWD domain-containing protein 4A n=1 Tax=Zootermopsis nevadensis TaxID=136037 RepID=A0A067R4E1_ZOONE|nr:RWD domain-containing protein 4A [Zootermopsis nevadensis]